MFIAYTGSNILRRLKSRPATNLTPVTPMTVGDDRVRFASLGLWLRNSRRSEAAPNGMSGRSFWRNVQSGTSNYYTLH